ncbi:uncharacterized protein Z518_04987 [Rhinocladiella mackenziei CBS 650.93]|uniref:DUF7892 domain-containing protein n=1 Tax=Rhinocladiella mackenziei CBS 650.93 TaxID=1442369 RepID=A0A0D2IV46_9EURO|nr:uncharacterized protein Z518_04987 [Rhinocladiella mackenziei CBS 650.93]KIX07011.1 hypothetical protein Z518_04987 [Rhinocladiella mackenziei CBS 650.93]
MDQSHPPSHRNGTGKRKYDHGPVMRVDKQFRNAEGSSYQIIVPQSHNARKIVFHPRNSSFALSSNASAHVLASSSTDSAAAPPAPGHTFVINTVGSMKTGQRHGNTRSSYESTVLSSENTPMEKRRCISSISPTDRKPIFRPSRPVKNSDQVHSDVWQTILGYCEPKFLLEAKTINSAFYRLLSDRSGIWRESRQNHFGREMPDCPPNLTEQQYVDLLAGRGCQNSACPRENTARVYWTFQVRLCAECFKQKTMRADDLPSHRKHTLPPLEDPTPPWSGKALWELLPLARSDGRRYMQPRSVNVQSNEWAISNGARQYAFLKSSYLQLEAEYLDFRRTHPGDVALRGWIDQVHRKTMSFMIEVADLELWHKRQNAGTTPLPAMRIDFFIARAAELSPPLSPNLLWKMAAFRRILKVQAPPSERSWKTLKEKILPYREQAQALEDYKMEMNPGTVPHPRTHIKRYRRLHEHRMSRKEEPRVLTPEQEFVLDLGQREFERCQAANVADEDLLLLCLKNVFDTYSRLTNRPTGLNFNGTTGPYCLSLDDARMIVEDVMEKHIPRFSPRGLTVFQNLKCRGCRRTDFVKTWSFTKAFEHMLDVHAKQVGEGLEFWQFAVPFSREYEAWTPGREEDSFYHRFPWYTVPWPRCLPLVPGHRDPSKLDNWHPAVNEPFVELPRRIRISAFEGRRPRPTEIRNIDFVKNLLFAAKILNGVWVDGLCQMKIALKYALDLYTRTQLTEPPLPLFTSCIEELHKANPAIDLRFRCGICVGEGKVYRTARQVKYKISVEGLLEHWHEKHKDSGASWSQGLMQLPTDSEVMEQIADADRRLQEEKEATRERTAELSNNVRKRPKLKGNVVMQARLAREAFDDLFPRED